MFDEGRFRVHVVADPNMVVIARWGRWMEGSTCVLRRLLCACRFPLR